MRSADALGWALSRAGRPRAALRWAHRALRLGSLDAGLRYHAGMTALAAGRRSEGRRNLRLALAHGLDGAAAARGARAGGAAMRRALLLCLLVLAALPAAAGAHPLGNFSVNHLSTVSVSDDRVDVRYILDQAEIPTFQERDVADAELLRRKQAEVQRRLVLTVDGRRVPLRPAGRPSLSHPEGAGGLVTTRVELPLSAAVSAPRQVALRDGTFPGRVGWHAIVSRPGRGTAVRASAPADRSHRRPAALSRGRAQQPGRRARGDVRRRARRRHAAGARRAAGRARATSAAATPSRARSAPPRRARACSCCCC